MNEITVQELKLMMKNKEDFYLIDVREPSEYEKANIGGENIPMGEINTIIKRIKLYNKEENKKIILHCKGGTRSGNVIKYLIEKEDFKDLYNLKGGILSYKKAFDDTLHVE